MIAMPRRRRPDESIQSTEAVLAIVAKHDVDGCLIGTAGSKIAAVTLVIAPGWNDFFIAWRSCNRDSWWTYRTKSDTEAMRAHLALIERPGGNELVDVREVTK